MLSIVTPAFNEQANLPLLYQRISKMAALSELDWEWVIVDDHSSDGTFGILRQLAQQDPRVRAIRLSRNFGSHTALRCALRHTRGSCTVILAADLQDPPELVPQLLEKWRAGAKIVWAVRSHRSGESFGTVSFARLYYWLMRHFVGIPEMAATGADFALLDRVVCDALKHFPENNVNLFALLTWMGFTQDRIAYDKQVREHGRSGWTLERKLKLLADSITAFTYHPVRFMSYLGVALGFLGFAYAAFIIYNAFHGQPVSGWSSLMVALVFIGGMQMLMMGVLGEYIWRAFDEARRRPRYLIESSTSELNSSPTEEDSTCSEYTTAAFS